MLLARDLLNKYNTKYHNNVSDYILLTNQAAFHWISYYADGDIKLEICKSRFDTCIRVENNFAAHLFAELIYINTNEEKYKQFIASSNFKFLDLQSVF